MTRTTSRSLMAAPFLAGFLALALPLEPVMAAQTEQAIDERGSSRFYEDALKRFHEGKYRGAAIQLKNALQRNPGSLPARILLGRTLNKMRLGGAAENQLKIARGAGADDALTLVPLGEAYLTQGKFEILLRELPPGQRPAAIEAGVRVLRGLALLQLRVGREAEREFNTALKLQPGHVRALIGLASLRLSQGRAKQAGALIDRAGKQAPDNENVWHLKGKLRQNLGDWKGALENYNKAISLSDTMLGARVDRAAVLLALGRQDDAVADIDFVRKIIPRHPQAGLLHALILARQNKHKEAAALLDDINQWLDVLPVDFVNNHPPTLMLLGTIHYTLKRFEDALPRLQRYLELMPHVISARKMLATIYLRRNDPGYALKLLEPALATSSRDLQLLTLLGTAHTRLRQYAKATEYFQKLATLAPQSTIAHTELAISRMATGQMEQARDELEKAVKLSPGRGRAGALLGLMHLRRHDTDSVLEIADRLQKANPKDPFPHNLAGSAHVQARQLEKARDRFLAALAIKPDYMPAIYNLATVAGRLEGPESAKKHYLAIIEKDPGQTRAMSALADIAQRQGDREEAIKWLDRASKTDPEAIKPQLRLVNLLIRKGTLPEAKQMIDSLENRAPRNLAVLDAKARVQIAGGNQADAIQTYRNAANAAAETAPQLYRISRAQLALQDLEGASFSLKAAVNLDPRLLPAQAALARLTYDLEGFQAAIEKVMALQTKFPGSPVADTVKGDVLMRNKHYGDAIASYEAAFAKTKTSTLARRIFQARRANGDRKAAVKGLADWIQTYPKDRRTRRVLALAYLEIGDMDAALSHHEALARMSDRDVMIINNLANLYHRRGDDRAFAYAKRAYDLAPKLPHVIDTYGWMLVQTGETEKGLRLLRNAQARANDQPAIGFHIAVALDALGRQKEALREMEAAIAMGTKFEDEDLARKLLDRLKTPN